MVAGAATIKMFGRQVPVRAQVHNLSMLSAHADRDELLRWARAFKATPRRTFIVHGEPQAADALRLALKDEVGWEAQVPDHLEEVVLE
jgi:metallo-beta-lactamase family protein